MHYMGTVFKYYVSITSMFKYIHLPLKLNISASEGSVKKFMFIYNFLRVFFTMKVVENSPQNTRNCTILKNFLGGTNPPSKGSQLRCSQHAASRHVYPKSKKF